MLLIGPAPAPASITRMVMQSIFPVNNFIDCGSLGESTIRPLSEQNLDNKTIFLLMADVIQRETRDINSVFNEGHVTTASSHSSE